MDNIHITKRLGHARSNSLGVRHRRLLLWALGLACSAAMAQNTTATDAGQDALLAAFTKADLNADGQLSPAEAKALPAADQAFGQLDTDGNQMLSQAEFVKGLQNQ